MGGGFFDSFATLLKCKTVLEGGTALVAQNGSKRTEHGCFREGAGPAPWPESLSIWGTSIGPVGAVSGYC